MAVGFERVGDAARDRWQRRLVQRVVGVLKEGAQRLGLGDAADSDRQVAIKRIEEVKMRLLAREEAIDDAHALSIAQQTLGDVRANKAGGAGDDIRVGHETPRLRSAVDSSRAIKWRKESVIIIPRRARCLAGRGTGNGRKAR